MRLGARNWKPRCYQRASRGFWHESGPVESELTNADTTVISLPMDQNYAFNGANRFYVKLINPDSTATASIRLRLLVDGDEVFDESANMRNASLSYTFLNFRF
jgi:hypothetical protein